MVNNNQIRILLCDDEPDFRIPLSSYLISEGYQVDMANDGLEALDLIDNHQFDLLLTDLRMPNMDGMELLKEVCSTHPYIKVLMFTALGTVETAVQAIKLGAKDFILKPVLFEDVKAKVKRLTEIQTPPPKTFTDKKSLAFHPTLTAMVGASPQLKELKAIIARVSKAGSFALIQGESGTGKELVAKALHALSNRSTKPFVAVNCAAIPEQLLESEFFGHVRGAFTGAHAEKKGYFETSDQGTIFLDEIGDLPLPMQAKLLRAIQEQEITPVGSTQVRKVDLTIIAASSMPLAEAVNTGKFRRDLFYRINIIEITAPPLRERTLDIKILAEHFLTETCQRLAVPRPEFSPRTLRIMENYRWPGNIRQLRNVVERSVVLATGTLIEPDSLPREIMGEVSPQDESPDFKTSVKQFEMELITKTLESCNYDKKLAAKILGIGLSSLYRKLEEFSSE